MRILDLPALAVTALSLLLTNCTASVPPAALPVPVPDLMIPDVDERALLLLLADQRLFEPVAVTTLLGEGAEIREALAVSLGRIGEPRGRGMLEGLLVDSDARVRRAAGFAIGELGSKEGVPALLRAAAEEDRETGELAVEALGKLETPIAEVTRSLEALPEGERAARLLPHLFRFRSPEATKIALAGLALADERLRAGAAYSLGRNATPEAAEALRFLLTDANPWLRGWAARGLGEVGVPEDLSLLLPLLDDPAPGPPIQALRAAGKLLAASEVPAPASWREKLGTLLGDRRPGVRLTACEVAGAFLPDPAIAGSLSSLARSGEEVRERELALLALAVAHDPDAEGLTLRALASSEPSLRAAAAQAAGLLDRGDLVDRLAGDAAAQVRVAVLEARLDLPQEEAANRVREALADEDPAVRATALEWLAEHPERPYEELVAAVAAARQDSIDDARLAAVRALVARAGSQPGERRAILAVLLELGGADDYLLRRAAIVALGKIGEPQPEIGPLVLRKGLEVYRQIVQQTAHPRFAELRTDRGVVTLRLACPEAPLTCLNFLQLAGQGFFDGLVLHRLVPDFVVQGGDPRGDGWGGPGYALRDEINRFRYARGAVGMALSGPDTGGSQFFITLAPQPHLDGGYTLFGTVIAGDELLDQIVQGDRILAVREVAAPQ